MTDTPELLDNARDVHRVAAQPSDRLAVRLADDALDMGVEHEQMARLREHLAEWAGLDPERVLLVVGGVEGFTVVAPETSA